MEPERRDQRNVDEWLDNLQGEDLAALGAAYQVGIEASDRGEFHSVDEARERMRQRAAKYKSRA